jgi:hypothetical protein
MISQTKQQGVDECGKLAGCLMDCRRAHPRITSLDSPLSTLSLSLSLSLSIYLSLKTTTAVGEEARRL